MPQELSSRSAEGLAIDEPVLAGRWAATWASVGVILLLLSFVWPEVRRDAENNQWVQHVSWFWERPFLPWDLPWKVLVYRYLAPILGVATLVAVAATRRRARSILLVALPTIAIGVAQALGFDDRSFWSLGNLLYVLGVVALLVGN